PRCAPSVVSLHYALPICPRLVCVADTLCHFDCFPNQTFVVGLFPISVDIPEGPRPCKNQQDDGNGQKYAGLPSDPGTCQRQEKCRRRSRRKPDCRQSHGNQFDHQKNHNKQKPNNPHCFRCQSVHMSHLLTSDILPDPEGYLT